MLSWSIVLFVFAFYQQCETTKADANVPIVDLDTYRFVSLMINLTNCILQMIQILIVVLFALYKIKHNC
ncbi:hypothetical protein AYR72_gp112 [Cnaphalocrocis medinalis granulovirus]|uniref:ORF124 n=1 Tax=Cnaphalocrocis medinalis granulovirus TaxID=1750712 RepID=A0A0X9HJ59_9BBAC|nr:hypothetical protein AYR72_gp112 [Cnaphalocrocis medinalis granulovirus]ALN42057.1 ORF124 [Cnaphalocrocis medinalis granulovirus]AMF83863.1 hypothetical protein [Cnaphalocrocis medinalis granulovirus]WPN08745.1 hypothetical protein [Cnaphalocrocis medinalis granulovirus]